MLDTVLGFNELTPSMFAFAGGKGTMLARMYQGGYPVPEGFVILPSAFEEGQLNEGAWKEIATRVNKIRHSFNGAQFAVRSSGLSEDSEAASFAGEFDTVLNMKTDEEIREALYTVYRSKYAERVRVYSSVQGMEQSHEIAIVVQLMVVPEISGVLFTADPITGSRVVMTGNYVFGLGEQLVSGEANAHSFTLTRPKGKYSGAGVFRKHAMKLYRYALRLEKELGGPQDLEWAISKGRVYLLQARPVTTFSPGNRDKFEWNDSLTGDFLWTNTNVGESIPDVFTPFSWSVIRALDEEQQVVPGHYLMSGNICGRVYSNISLPVSAFQALGFNSRSILAKMSNVFGKLPEGIGIPVYPFSKWSIIKALVPRILYSSKRTREAVKGMSQYLKDSPEECAKIIDRIHKVKTKEELLRIWRQDLWPRNVKGVWAAFEGTSQKMQKYVKLKEKLSRLVGSEEANLLLSNVGGNAQLESLGPVIGISRVIRGDMSRREYLVKYGHRGPHEHELSIPSPGESRDLLEKQIKDIEDSPINVEELLDKQRVQYEEAWNRFEQLFPGEKKRFKRQVERVLEGPQVREAARSEWTRGFRVNRAFALKAGELAGIADDVFFLYLDEVLSWLEGGELEAKQHINARKVTYAKYQALPPLPSIIRGRFDPFKWAEEPNRRMDYFNPMEPMRISPESETLKGFAGAAGRIEGKVRVLTQPEDGDQLKPGEILVTSTTNVGWTTLFPKASAIITDIGAPLSHAAIVARELGIPAVVGCGNATTRLKTGDRIIVDGGQGIIQICPPS
ncbi:PEP/pyruvate-binding domain-containing protein [Paenibacillus tuaregi]|uniref:PEP/pyruvate-binding domain-containing protein n=1 Tax=Paenibacillus tuaregi TaxID=1816681 RepID=UPI000838D35C|nr:PEP/pyruvate-binding domain-containing protein [Paenibacillus tuaregi]